MPWSRKRFTKLTRTRESLTTTPIRAIIPIIGRIPIGVKLIRRPTITPTILNGITAITKRGWEMLLNRAVNIIKISTKAMIPAFIPPFFISSCSSFSPVNSILLSGYFFLIAPILFSSILLILSELNLLFFISFNSADTAITLLLSSRSIMATDLFFLKEANLFKEIYLPLLFFICTVFKLLNVFALFSLNFTKISTSSFKPVIEFAVVAWPPSKAWRTESAALLIFTPSIAALASSISRINSSLPCSKEILKLVVFDIDAINILTSSAIFSILFNLFPNI